MTTLVQKLCEVMEAVNYIQKTGYNKQQGYRYAQESDVVEKVRTELAKRKIFLMNSVENISFRTIKTAKEYELTIATLTVKYTLLDGETGEKLEFMGVGEGMDAGDKAIYKAQTGALKYALMKTFLIPTGDDPERDNDEEDANSITQNETGTNQQPKRSHQQKENQPKDSANVVPLNDKATEKQRNMIFAIAKNKLAEEEVKSLVRFVTGKDSMEDLTKKEASILISLIQNHSREQLILPVIAQNKGLSNEQLVTLMKSYTEKEKIPDLTEQEINYLTKLIQETDYEELVLLVEGIKTLDIYKKKKEAK